MGRFRGGAEGGKYGGTLGDCENTEEGLFCFSVKGLRIGWKNVILQLDNKRRSGNSFQQQAQMNLIQKFHLHTH